MNDADRSEQRDAVADSTARDDAPGGLLARLAKTRRNLGRALGGLFGGGALDADTLDALHDQLLLADVGVEASARIINRLRDRANVRSADEWIGALRAEIGEILAPCARPLEVDRAQMPFVILMVGVHGVGKTPTLAKLAARL
ncbi:MAG: signal recognition particle receptor subunit alpha, partial [bacterium]